jgi:transposase
MVSKRIFPPDRPNIWALPHLFPQHSTEASRAEITSLVGLAPFNRDSGHMRGKRSIMGGRQSVRQALYMAALTGMKRNEKLRSFYQRLVASGRPFKVAIVACMRKLLVILNAMIREKKTYQELST